MKKAVFLLFLAGGFITSFGQNVDYNTIILPSTAKDVDYGERLVQLAWENNPQNYAVMLRSEIADKNLKQAQWSWLDRIIVSGNVNEFTLSSSEAHRERANFWPKYNFGVSFSLGTFAQTPLEVKKRRAELAIADLGVNEQKLTIRAEVLRRYNQYLMVKDQLVIQKKLEAEMGINLDLAKDKFNRGAVDYSTLSDMTSNQYTLIMRTRELEAKLQETIINIEEMIGVKLNMVIPNAY